MEKINKENIQMATNLTGPVKKYNIEPPKSIADQIYLSIKEKILLAQIKPGQHLIEAKLSEIFEVSRTPIREAFRRLEQDGLIERLLQGGVRVTPLKIRTLEEVLKIRLILEIYVAELVFENITKPDIYQLKKINKQAHIYLSNSEDSTNHYIREIWELNNLFHEIILNLTDNEQLIRICSQLRDLVQRFRIMSHFENINRIRSWMEHEQMIQCFENKNKEALKKIWQNHLKNSASIAFEFLR